MRFHSGLFLAPLAAMLLSAFHATASAQIPLFEVRFNDSNNLDLQLGSALGAGGSGVSEKIEDKSYSADVSQDGPGPVAILPSDGIVAQELDELTITAWYKPRGDLKHDSTLFDFCGTLLIWDQKTKQWVFRIDTRPAGSLKPPMYWFSTGSKPPLGSWTTAGEWTFIAMVWKKTEKKVTFYQGSSSTAATVAGEHTRSEEVMPLTENTKVRRVIGNTSGSKKDRPFNGNIDDVRFFTKALDANAIEKIQQADLKNENLSAK